ncbi:MAG TPA: DUF2066 domain-containing protein [Stellaceae bacterium]|nr:DUF2066 domain-containing protein [Stellaceae bacterium]
MTLPLVPAIRRARAGRRFGAAVLALVMAASASPAGAQGEPDPYSATVSVDATAPDVAKARHLARLDGERRALTQVIEHLSGAAAAPSLPKLGDQAISDMVASYEVANEHMSAVRYLADYTFHFNPSTIKQLMQQAGVHAAPAPSQGAASASAIVLPVFADGAKPVLWDDPNAWRQAWRKEPDGGAGQLLVPLGDARDVATIDAARAAAGNPEALAAIARQNGGGDVVVVLATAERRAGTLAGLAVSLKRYRGGSPVGAQDENLTARPGESEAGFLERAASATANLIQNAPAAASAAPAGPEATLAAVVPISGLADWVALQKRLASVAIIHRIDLMSLTVEEAKIEIRYAGTIDQLKSSLAGLAFGLGGGDPVWRIAPAGAATAR